MNRILQVDLQEKWVRVQPGVVLDQLNDHLKPFGVFFAPNLSPSSRATLGGMISTDACGKGSRIYGRTSNHILDLSFVFQEGTIWQSREISLEQLSELKKQDNIVGRVHRVVDAIVTGKATLIEKQFPKMSRFLTGYNLARVYSAKRDRFNLNNLLAGSEGTLVTLCEAKLKLTPIPKYKHLLVIKYQSFNDALQQARLLLDYEPAAIETIDEKILELARGDAIYHHVRDFIADEEWAPTRAINLVEFSGNDAGKLEQRVRDLCRTISPSPRQGTPDPSLEGSGDSSAREILPSGLLLITPLPPPLTPPSGGRGFLGAGDPCERRPLVITPLPPPLTPPSRGGGFLGAGFLSGQGQLLITPLPPPLTPPSEGSGDSSAREILPSGLLLITPLPPPLTPPSRGGGFLGAGFLPSGLLLITPLPPPLTPPSGGRGFLGAGFLAGRPLVITPLPPPLTPPSRGGGFLADKLSVFMPRKMRRK